MNIGVFQHGWWNSACAALSHQVTDLAIARTADGNAYSADLASRIEHGTATLARLQGLSIDLLLDNGGTGLGFSRVPGGTDELKIAHEVANKILISHLIDPVTTALQGLDWPTTWQSLQSPGWIKAVWDRAQVTELQRFGVPNVVHLPMAAVDREYNTTPLDPSQTRPVVSFVGGQNSTYFISNNAVASGSLLAGVLAHAARSDTPALNFFDIFYTLYGLALPPQEGDDKSLRSDKVRDYFNAKFYYHAALCMRNRDRFVIFLKRHLGDQFHLVGRGWDKAYGLPTAPRFETDHEYLDNFRTAAININLVNGNAETGLNMRHFEITAAGGFMLCYEQPELAEHFEIGKECAVFGSESDLIDKTNYYLANPDERAAIALAGQKRTLSQHLYSHRLGTLLAMVTPKEAPVEFSKTNMWDDLRALVPRAGVVLDCGANIGQMARSFRNLYPDADIYCFEPVSSVFEKLRDACCEVNAKAVKKAVSDHDGTATIHLTASPEANSLLGFQEGNPCAQWTRPVGEENVEVCTLDGWCRQEGVNPDTIDVIKLDVQGAELKALYGAKRLLETVRVIYLEVSFVPIYKDCPLFPEIDRFLTECGYRRHAVYPSDQPHNWGDALYVKADSRSVS